MSSSSLVVDKTHIPISNQYFIKPITRSVSVLNKSFLSCILYGVFVYFSRCSSSCIRPQSHLEFSSMPHFTRFNRVRSVPVRMRFNVYQSRYGSWCPRGNVSLIKSVLADSSFHFSKRSSAGLFVSGSHVPRKLPLDLNRLCGATYPFIGCRSSINCFVFSFLVYTSLLM